MGNKGLAQVTSAYEPAARCLPQLPTHTNINEASFNLEGLASA
jgi:hypothetical protein